MGEEQNAIVFSGAKLAMMFSCGSVTPSQVVAVPSCTWNVRREATQLSFEISRAGRMGFGVGNTRTEVDLILHVAEGGVPVERRDLHSRLRRWCGLLRGLLFIRRSASVDQEQREDDFP